MSTIVGTNIEVTNIKYDSDTTAMIVSSAGGGAGTVPQGLAKSWIARLNTGDANYYDSFNVGSTTDSGTGRITVTFTNDFSSINFCVVMGVESNYPYKGYPASASTMFLNTLNSANNHADGMGALTAHGDLA